MQMKEALDLLCYWHERTQRAERILSRVRLPIGTRVRSLNWAKAYGHVIGWDDILGMAVIRWEGTADHGPEACEFQEFDIISCEKYDLDAEIASLDEGIAVEQAIDKMWRLAS